MQKTKTSLNTANMVVAAWLIVLAPLAMAQAQKRDEAAAPAKAASAAKATTSVVVLDQLLKADNDAAIAALHKGGLLPGAAPGATPNAAPRGPVEMPPTNIRVAAIYGTGSASSANVVVNGMPVVATSGAVLGECRVMAIVDRCVTLKPVNEKTKAARCPSACWTGEQGFAPQPMQGQGVPLQGAPLPYPLPRY